MLISLARHYLGVKAHALFAVKMDVPANAAPTIPRQRGEENEGEKEGEEKEDTLIKELTVMIVDS